MKYGVAVAEAEVVVVVVVEEPVAEQAVTVAQLEVVKVVVVVPETLTVKKVEQSVAVAVWQDDVLEVGSSTGSSQIGGKIGGTLFY